MTSPEPNLSEVLLSLAKAWPTQVLLIAFGLAEVVNLGLLPSALETIKTKITIAQTTTADATAAVAKLRQDAEAKAAAEEARTKAEIARHAERQKQALALKATAEAKRLREIAQNSSEMQAAEARIQRQKAVIAEEKAQHEERYRKAEAVKTAAEAELSEVEGALQTATQRANLIKARSKALIICIGAANLEYQRTRGRGIDTDPCHFSQTCEFRWNRQNCLSRLQ